MNGRVASRRASVLLLVLWIVMILGVLGFSYMSSVRTQLSIEEASRGRLEALWAARAGVEQARAVLESTDIGVLTATDALLGDPKRFANQKVGPASVTLVLPPDPETGEARTGLSDEGARLNVNIATEESLLKLDGITQEMADSLLDWVDNDSFPRAQGAEEDYYRALPSPRSPRNGPLLTLRELVRIRGWEEVCRAAWPDPWERYAARAKEATPTLEPDQARQLMDRLTVWSVRNDPAPDGDETLDLATATEDQMKKRIKDLKDDEARAIVAYRNGGKKYNSPIDLFEVTEAAQQQQGQTGGQAQPGQGNQQQSSGRKIFDLKRVGQLIDYFRVGDSPSTPPPGGINLNTASQEILLTVPGLTEAIVTDLLQRRQTSQGLDHAGALAEVSGVNEEIFKKVYPLVCARVSRFRVVARGREPDSKAQATVEAVVALKEKKTSIVYWREE